MIRRAALAVITCLLAVPAAAQDDTQAVPPPAPVTAAPLGPLGGPPTAPYPSLTPNAPPAVTPPATTPPIAGAAPPAGPAPSYPPAPAQTQNWLPRGTAEVQALDKVNARNVTLAVRVGASVTFGSLTIAAQACVVTPPDQAQDAAAFLVITDSHPGEPGFSGWMVADAPSVSMLQNPIYDVRVTGCRT